MSELLNFENKIGKNNSFIIFGAQNHARAMYEALQIALPKAQVLFFLVSARKNNPECIDGIEVKTIDSALENGKELPVLVATPDLYWDEIVETLHQHGFYNIVNGTFSSALDNELREIYYTKGFLGEAEGFKKLSDIVPGEASGNMDFCMYMAKSEKDRPLINTYEFPDYVRPVQAGAALAENIVMECRDNEGDNISKKNRNYCECTVTYYAWKHAKEDYVGLCHYRRHFDWNEDDINKIRSGCVDVVLPYPVITKIYEIHYRPYIAQDIFDTMLKVLKEDYPEYYEVAQEAVQGDVFYPCNIVLARKEIFAQYAQWLFSVLEKVEAICGDETVRTDRYLGYLAEHLTTFYFIKNRKQMRIAHSKINILR